MRDLILGLLLTWAACHSRARPQVMVLGVVWLAYTAAKATPFPFLIYPYIDAASFYPLAALAYRRPSWWAWVCALMALAAVQFQILYWQAYHLGIYVAGAFPWGLYLIFLTSVLALIIGNTDAKQFISALGFGRGALRNRAWNPVPARVFRRDA